VRVVVTGASGNMGTSLLAALGDDPAVDEIVGIARRRPRWQPAKTRWVTADIAEDDLGPAFAGADAVLHLAWAIQPSRDLATLQRINVTGSERVFRATVASGARFLLHTSSIGAYSAGPDTPPVDESWPTHGIDQSFYSRQKAYVERLLDVAERDTPELRVARVRPAITGKRTAAAGLRRLFAGPFLPNPLVGRLPVAPAVRGLRIQLVHTEDVARAMHLALRARAGGAFNLAAAPVIDAQDLARALGGPPIPVPPAAARAVAALSWRLRLQPTPPGWLDMALGAPLMDTGRAQRELGWEPTHTATATLDEMFAGIRESADGPTPPLQNSTSGPGRIRDLATGVGRRAGVR